MENWNYQSSKDKGWHTGEKMKCADKCSFSESASKPIILIEQNVYAAIRKLCMEIKCEWQMLLIGDETGTGLVIFDYYIPKQEVGWAHVKNLDCITPEFIREKGIIAGIHSHADMAVFFSPTDEEFTNQSIIKNNIVINNKFETKAVMRRDLPCGMVKFDDAQVQFYFPAAENVLGMDNIGKAAYVYNDKDSWYGGIGEAIDRLDDERNYVPPKDADFPLEQDIPYQGGYGYKSGKKNKKKKGTQTFLRGGLL